MPPFQRRAGHFLVVEVKCFAAEDLIILVALPSDQDQVTAAGLSYRLIDRYSTIRNLSIRLSSFLNSLFSVAQDLFRIFCTWIIGGENYDIAETAGRFAHRRTF